MNATKKSSIAAFSLLEVLVALVVLSIGMMGVAGLFVSSLQDSGSAILRTRAINFADDMADRIRANNGAGASYVATTATTGSNNPACADTGVTGSVTAATACTEEELALYDLYTWKQALQNPSIGLPAGNATITRSTATVPPTYTITVQWSERDDDQSYVLAFRM